MTKPCIICVAITGSVPRKQDNPAIPISIAEQIDSTQAACEAGASIAHCHVLRMEDNIRLDRPTLAPSNAALVSRTADLCAAHDRPVATTDQARAILGLT